MIDLYYWPTPNGHKITMFLEETGLPYDIKVVNIGRGDQFDPEFLKIAPNNRMPAIVDHEPADGGEPISVFEGGAILIYLAEKTGRFLPTGLRERIETLEWLFWQTGGLGPMAGQNSHFNVYAPEPMPYAQQRYENETNRLFGVMDNRLADHAYLAGKDYTIADMASYPWVYPYERLKQNIDDFPNLKRWFDEIYGRPATAEAYRKGSEISKAHRHEQGSYDEESKKILFGQTAATVRG